MALSICLAWSCTSFGFISLDNFAASIAGAVASITISAPADVIKTRIQSKVSTSAESGFTMDIRQFSQAFMGEPSLITLAMNDLVDVKSSQDLYAASQLLTASSVCCLDAF